MKKPAPQIGQIIRFDYLWREEQERGRIEGAKDWPCAAIVVLQRAEDGSQRVYVAPITHSQHRDGLHAIEIPAQFNTLTGLDSERCWLITSEFNRVDWSDPGIVPARPDRWFYGSLPRGIAQRALEEIVRLSQLGVLRSVERT